VPIGEFINRVENYTGKAYKVYLKKREETGEVVKFFKRY